jgi:NADPH:quinone reductase
MRALLTSAEPPHVALSEAEPPVPTPNEAVVSVEAISLNRGEVRALTMVPPGSRVGWDLAGTVLSAAADGTGPANGARVVGLVPTGGWAEQVAVPTNALATLPDSVSFAAAACLPIAGLTALRALELAGYVGGKRVAVTGASGGVGRFAVQLAAIGGAHVTAISASEQRARGLVDLGASQIDHELTPDGPGFDVILEGVGGVSLGSAMQRINDYGVIVVYASTDERPVTFPSSAFRNHPGARLYALRIFEELAMVGGCTRDLERLIELMTAGKLDPQISLETSWLEPEDALKALRDRRVVGKAVLLLG